VPPEFGLPEFGTKNFLVVKSPFLWTPKAHFCFKNGSFGAYTRAGTSLNGDITTLRQMPKGAQRALGTCCANEKFQKKTHTRLHAGL
jgi:hypothetical protein